MKIRQSHYFKQVELLLRLLPIIAENPDFVLKGGTAINLFIHDMPRLSVDIFENTPTRTEWYAVDDL